MSLLSSVILPKIEKDLIALEPQIAEFILKQIIFAGNEVLDWAKTKISTAEKPSLNGSYEHE